MQAEKRTIYIDVFSVHIFLIKSNFEFFGKKIFVFFEKIRRDSCIIGEKRLVLHRKFSQ